MNEPNPQPSAYGYGPADDGIDLWELWDILWSEKWWIIGASLLFGVVGAGYSMTLAPVYDAKVVLYPVQQAQASGSSSLLAQLAPIAGLDGISASSQLGLATLQSTQFAEDFITRNNLLPVLVNGTEKTQDIRDGVSVFQQNVVRISSDVKTGLVSITVSWKDPAVAAAWANELAKSANDTLRDRALVTAERNLAYLKAELPVTTSVTVQQSIGRLLDQEMQTVMLARGNPEYAFKVVDLAKVPKTRSSPKRSQMTIIALLAGGFLGVLFVFIRRAIRARRESLVAAAAAKA